MIKEMFLGRNPSSFHVNAVVKAFIISETFLWSAWNFVMPILAIFAANDIEGGSIQIASSSFSVYLISRVIFELFSGRTLEKSNDHIKYIVSIIGIVFLSVSYIGLAVTDTILMLFVCNILLGIGLGIATPAKNALFSSHLDKNKETTEWGMYDAITFTGMALATALGGFIAQAYGFNILFFAAAILNLLALIPYVLFFKK